MSKSKHISWHGSLVTKEMRQKRNKHKSAVLWFTGLSGSGKSTITVELERKLYQLGIHTYRLDGDNIRHGLNKNLGFTAEERSENIRRIGEVSKLFIDAGVLALTAFISPYRDDRNLVRALLPSNEFIEIYVKCRLEVCEERDPKGLYKKARAGEIAGFTGIDAPYESPISPELTIDTEKLSVEEAAQRVIHYLLEKEYLTV
ncbi:adenylyl-sulfate kinase [Virgibacillus dokdonensis]|uniref:Adenylyl-sulfate kinase n=1 Tax=Virgibacillus dokdonensis TaxID=302167 RepID=A0A2K9IYR2_9BACI|nr:adenylyl-sulfate kinase [Virgibacillus dokdonensis]AUJ24604.1 putative adenylyl-sulfate kinase [Virgibacillus dokdonensis]